MRDSEIRQKLLDLNLQDLIFQQRQRGRARVSPGFLQDWNQLHILAQEILEDDRRSREVVLLAEFLKIVTYSLHYLSLNTRPRYYVYTDAQVLDWFINQRRGKYSFLKSRCIEGIHYLLESLLRFESASLAGIETISQEQLDRTIVIDRIDKIGMVFDRVKSSYRLMFQKDFLSNIDIARHASISDYVYEEPRASGLVHFSCFPQTEFHDEVVFLRTIHIAELCFWGIRLSIVEALELIKRESLARAGDVLAHANGFANILHETFKLLRTMPPEHFADFRDATGDASAVQSRNYQLMEAYFLGVDQRKLPTYEKDPNLRFLKKYAHPNFVSLHSVLGRIENRAVEWEDVIVQAKKLDKKLLSWRGLHLAFAKAYLPKHAVGTGGTSGVSYLEKYLGNTLFSETQFDFKLIATIFSDLPEVPDMFRAMLHFTIAPLQDLS